MSANHTENPQSGPQRDDADQALSVLRGIWSTTGQTGVPLDEVTGSGRVCKRTAHLGIKDVDDDLRASWRGRLEREGKLPPDSMSIRDLVLGPASEPTE